MPWIWIINYSTENFFLDYMVTYDEVNQSGNLIITNLNNVIIESTFIYIYIGKRKTFFYGGKFRFVTYGIKVVGNNT